MIWFYNIKSICQQKALGNTWSNMHVEHVAWLGMESWNEDREDQQTTVKAYQDQYWSRRQGENFFYKSTCKNYFHEFSLFPSTKLIKLKWKGKPTRVTIYWKKMKIIKVPQTFVNIIKDQPWRLEKKTISVSRPHVVSCCLLTVQ